MTPKKTPIAALDVGDVWTGIALSDASCIVAAPHDTVETKNLLLFLNEFLKKYQIKEVAVGIPITLRGKESEQTKKTKETFLLLQNTFPEITFIMFDERFSSKQASETQKGKKKGTREKIKVEKLKNHAIAAAFILTNYLELHKNSVAEKQEDEF